MNANEYQVAALRTSKQDHTPETRLIDGILGLNGEAGELADLLKKHLSQGHPLDYEKLTYELGDVLWYCAQTAMALDIDLGHVMKLNLAKLKQRYPQGFEAERSLHREAAAASVDRDSRENSL